MGGQELLKMESRGGGGAMGWGVEEEGTLCTAHASPLLSLPDAKNCVRKNLCGSHLPLLTP